MVNKEVKRLALSIGSCETFVEAVNGSTSGCSQVVNWQRDQHGVSNLNDSELFSVGHRPEPWAGDLENSRIMFLSSNPSFDPLESYPTFKWSDEDAADFYVRRFTQDDSRRYGATDGPRVSDFDRTILQDGSRTKQVKTWKILRTRASVLLDKPLKNTYASSDYVMTEVVHCKSRNEVGVVEALPTCVSKWFKPVLSFSGAKLIVVSGSHAGAAVKNAILEISNGELCLRDDWGSWGGKTPARGRWPKSTAELESWTREGKWSVEDQMNHMQEIELLLDGELRKFWFLWMPHPVRSVPQKLDNPLLYSPDFIRRLKNIVQ